MAEIAGLLQLTINAFFAGIGSGIGNLIVIKLLLGKLEDKMSKQKNNNQKEKL